MKQYFLSIILICMFVNILLAVNEKLFKASDLQKDLTYLRESLENNHPNLYKYTSKAQFDSLYHQINQKLAEKKQFTEYEFYLMTAPVIEAVKCGHTRLFLTDTYKQKIMVNKPFLPYDLYVANKEIFIKKDFSKGKIDLSGQKLISLNGIFSEQLINEAYHYLPSDGLNTTAKDWSINQLPYSIFSILLGYPESYKVETANGVLDVKGLTLNDFLKVKKQKEYKSLDFEVNKDKNLAVLTVKTFVSQSGIDFKKFYKQAFDEINKKRITNLILDLRDNSGGDPENAVYLLNHLMNQDYIYFSEDAKYYDALKIPIKPESEVFTGRIYCLINGGCFSTTGHFLALFRQNQLGILIGEQSGGSFTCNDNSKSFKMPVTGISMNIARSEFKVKVDKTLFNEGIYPDIYKKNTIQDEINGFDTVMSYARQALAIPPVTMINKVSYRDQRFDNYIAGCAFLVDTGKRIVAVTCKHALWVAKTDKMKFVSFGDELKEWRMQRKDDTLRYVVTDKLLNEDKNELIGEGNVNTDFLVFSIKENKSDIKPLKIRKTELKQGESLYMVGWTFQDKKGSQRVYLGDYAGKQGTHLLMNVEMMNLAGLSGAPVIDADGNLVGIVSNYYNDEIAGKWYFSPCSASELQKILDTQ